MDSRNDALIKIDPDNSEGAIAIPVSISNQSVNHPID